MRALLLAIAAVAAACERPAAQLASIDDAPLWRLAPEPVVSIGVADGDERYMFRSVRGIVRTRDGHIFIADAAPSLTLFDSTGRFVKAMGRSGSGPGEFSSQIRVFAYRGDSVALWDFLQRRISVFSARGEFGRTVNIVVPRVHWPAGTTPTSSCCRVASAFTDGSFALEFPSVVVRGPGPERYGMLTLARVSADGSRSDTIGTFRDYRYQYDATRVSGLRQIRETMRFEHAVIGDTVIGGNGEGQFLLRTVPGGVIDTVRLASRPVPITDSIKAVIAKAYNDAYARDPRRFEGPVKDLYEGEYAEFLPAYTRVTSDAAGRVWLGQWTRALSGDSMTFHVYSTRGAPLARIRLPWNNWTMHAGADHVSLVESDSLGVEYVRVYRILREP